jgi:hypothetical protein
VRFLSCKKKSGLVTANVKHASVFGTVSLNPRPHVNHGVNPRGNNSYRAIERCYKEEDWADINSRF